MDFTWCNFVLQLRSLGLCLMTHCYFMLSLLFQQRQGNVSGMILERGLGSVARAEGAIVSTDGGKAVLHHCPMMHCCSRQSHSCYKLPQPPTDIKRNEQLWLHRATTIIIIITVTVAVMLLGRFFRNSYNARAWDSFCSSVFQCLEWFLVDKKNLTR